MVAVSADQAPENRAFARLFFIFIGTAFLLSLGLTGAAVIPALNERIGGMYEEALGHELVSYKGQVEQYLRDRALVLKDIASFPIISNGVMQGDPNNANLKDFLDSSLILGSKERLSLLNMGGELIYTTQPEPPIDYDADAPWVRQLLDAQRSEQINLMMIDGRDYVQIAVPVRYQGHAEGVLVSEMQFDIAGLLEINKADAQRAVQLHAPDQVIGGALPSFKTPFTLNERLDGTDIDLCYTVDYSRVESEQMGSIVIILVGLGGSQAIAFTLFLLLGRHIVVQPYKRLAESKKKARLMEAAIFHANDAVIVCDANLNDPGPEIVYANDAFTQISGYSKEEIIGQNPRILQGEKTDPQALAALRDSLQQGKPYKGELVNYHKNGQEYWLDISVVPVRDELGNVTHFAAIERDITERKAFEKELIDAKEAAEQSSIAKSEFLANMSHELRTPMNGILGMAELLLDMKQTSDEKDMLQTIHNSGETLLSLLNDILDISKVESGDVRIEQIPFDLDIAVRELFQLYQPLTSAKGLQLYLEKDETLPICVMGDLGRIQQVLRNLISNALKFTEKGSITLALRRASDLVGRSVVEFTVSDTGIGIAQDKQEGIFEKFTQADSSTSRKYGGTGLGLAITRQLVELMQGSITVQSTLGEGTHFCCQLPLAIAPEGSKPVNVIAEEGYTGAGSGFDKQASILVVDDHPVNIKFIDRLLIKMGFTKLEKAEDGRQALQKLASGSYDIVFMDCQMPEMDGYEATRTIREQEAGTQLHQTVIAMTANAMLGDKEKCLKAGMDDYISKPVKVDKLTQMLRKWIPCEGADEDAQALADQAPPPASVTSDSPAGSVIDMAHFNELFGDSSADDLEALFTLFIQQGHADLQALKASGQGGDVAQWKKDAHKIKGSAANLGATQLMKACRQAEADGFASPEQADAMFAQIQAHFDAFEVWLQEYLRR